MKLTTAEGLRNGRTVFAVGGFWIFLLTVLAWEGIAGVLSIFWWARFLWKALNL